MEFNVGFKLSDTYCTEVGKTVRMAMSMDQYDRDKHYNKTEVILQPIKKERDSALDLIDSIQPVCKDNPNFLGALPHFSTRTCDHKDDNIYPETGRCFDSEPECEKYNEIPPEPEPEPQPTSVMDYFTCDRYTSEVAMVWDIIGPFIINSSLSYGNVDTSNLSMTKMFLSLASGRYPCLKAVVAGIQMYMDEEAIIANIKSPLPPTKTEDAPHTTEDTDTESHTGELATITDYNSDSDVIPPSGDTEDCILQEVVNEVLDTKTEEVNVSVSTRPPVINVADLLNMTMKNVHNVLSDKEQMDKIKESIPSELLNNSDLLNGNIGDLLGNGDILAELLKAGGPLMGTMDPSAFPDPTKDTIET
jgi:hypothetical protein